MAAIATLSTSYNSPEFLGTLYNITPSVTPFLSLIGGQTGGEPADIEFSWQKTENIAAAVGAAIAEGADPSYTGVDRSQIYNVCTIFQYGIEVSYSKAGNMGLQGVPGTIVAVPGSNGSLGAGELAFQTEMKLKRMARDVNKTMLEGTYTRPTANTGRQTRGLQAAIATAGSPNSVDNGGVAAMAKADVEELLREMVANGAPLENIMAFAPAFQRQRFSEVYGTDLPRDRYVGGVRISTVVTDFCDIGVVHDRDVTSDNVYLADMNYLKVRHHPIPGKGSVFVEPKPNSGSSFKFMLYGELGLEYGLPEYHGEIINNTTS